MIAIDMEMPSCCANCGMSYGLDKDSSCGCFITQGTNFDMYNSKLANCPLVEIVTCKDCKHWKDSDGVYRRGVGAESKCPINIKEVFEGNFYCKFGERRE